MEQRFSLFLTPCAADYDYLDRMIRETSAACAAAPFEPHVTVYSGRLVAPDLLEKGVRRAVDGVGPVSLRFAGIGFGLEYFKSLYIEFEESAALRAIHDRLKRELGEDSGYRLIPHLSLLYSEIPIAEKEALARRIVLEREEILFDQVKVVVPRNLDEGWRDTGQWHTLCRQKMRGTALPVVRE